jgi:hypothetical protein
MTFKCNKLENYFSNLKLPFKRENKLAGERNRERKQASSRERETLPKLWVGGGKKWPLDRPLAYKKQL